MVSPYALRKLQGHLLQEFVAEWWILMHYSKLQNEQKTDFHAAETSLEVNSHSKPLPTFMDWNSNVHQGNAKSLGVCKLNQVFSDLALAVTLLRK